MGEWISAIGAFIADMLTGVWIKSIGAMIVAVVLLAFDMAHPSVLYAVYLMMFDLVFGIAHAVKDSRFDPAGIRRGLAKIISYSLGFVVTTVADKGLYINVATVNLTFLLCCFVISSEALSSFRHLEAFGGVKLPPWLVERLEFYKRGQLPPQFTGHHPAPPSNTHDHEGENADDNMETPHDRS